MKTITYILTALAIITPLFVSNVAYASPNRSGYILLQVEKNGEAWYVYPENGNRYFLGRPDDAFKIMKKLALGATHDYITNTSVFPTRLSGMILLDVDKNGEAYYIYPKDKKKYYLGRPADAFRIMNQLGQGIFTAGLTPIPVGNINNSPTPVATDKIILQNVNFTSQAPFSQWTDLRQEDGCEEASSFMAVKWAIGQSFTKQDALDSILGSSTFTQKKYGEYRDISTDDTLNWIIKDYFNYQNAAIKKNATVASIISELEKGNIIIAAMNGQELYNPNFIQPGPPHHMMLVKGYDPVKKVFITNDPGTRRGESYEYDEDVLYKAIRDYKTGFKEPDTSIVKDVIVVWK